MLRSMFSAVSGLRSHQTMMDVTGNNVSNVNTAGFKSTRTTFQETLAQMTRGGAGGVAGNQGGQNPMQIGLGTQVAGTDMVFTQGASQDTGRATDLSIQGDGFFRIQTADGPAFMRSGAFSFDNAGNLVTPGGDLVMGVDGPITYGNVPEFAPNGPTDIAINGRGEVSGRDADGDEFVFGTIELARFNNPGGLERAGNGLFLETAASGGAIAGEPGEDGMGGLQSGTLEMSNVDLAQEFTNLILAQRGFQANARTITTSDELLQELVNLKR